MNQLDQSAATLRIYGDLLVPEDISRWLDGAPTHAQAKGAEICDEHSGIVRVADTGMWQLSAVGRHPEDLGSQIEEILAQLTDDLAAWAAVSECFAMDLFCGVFTQSRKSELPLTPTVLAALGQRGIALQLGIYSCY